MRRQERPEGRPRPTVTTTGRHQNTSGDDLTRYLRTRGIDVGDVLERLAALEAAVFPAAEPFEWPYRLPTYQETYEFAEPNEAAS
jgi:hypothetical protein